MSNLAIRVDGLSKQYKIGLARHRHDTLRDEIMSLLSVFRSNGYAHGSHPSDTIWALKNVSFEVKRGEVLGIIGRNGAGKSTLLKILSRITEPSEGRAEIQGRVGSLLEVGTGFHGELTGRENVYLNGAILGMKKAEIDRKFDEIVAFAEVEKFIDTPVKRYSSGMHVRLAFAVAAHLEPEILIIDEVLAVGDLNFQNKCLGKMGEIRSGGRTVFFVSHNMAAIENLCPSTIVLDAGRIVFEDESKQAINYYLKSVLSPATAEAGLADRKDRSGNGKVRLTSFHVEDLQGNKLTAVRSGMDVVFVFGFRCRGGEKLTDVDVGFSIHSNFDQMLFVLYSSYVGQTFQRLPSAGEFRCHVERLPLSAGSYTVGARVTVAGEEADWLRNAVGRLDVALGDFYGTGREGFGGSTRFLVRGEWGIQELCSIY